MRFYTKQHAHYCGVDLHAKTMYLCILDKAGKVVLHQNLPTTPEAFLSATRRFRKDLVVAVECMFSWYWLADLCDHEGIAFVLGHALYIKAVHGGKVKNDRIDSQKIAALLRGGLFPMAYAYPQKMRATRDLLRRRMVLMRKRAELIAHVQNTNTQYNLSPIPKKLAYRANRAGVAERFADPSARKNVELDLALATTYDQFLNDIELYILHTAKDHDADALYRLRSIPGIGKILSLAILYEVGDIHRFPRVQDFVSYCRLVKPAHESAGHLYGCSGKKIGNAHLKWAFSEAAVLFLRDNPDGQRLLARTERRHGKGKALSILAHKLGRATYTILRRKTVFDKEKFMNG